MSDICAPQLGLGTIADDVSGIFYCGDNLEILSELRLVPDESVDLVYLDPPFNSRRTFNVVYKGSEAQEVAFKDCWSWDEAAPTFAKVVTSADTPKALRTLLESLKTLLLEDDPDLLAYLSMMGPRLVALHRVLKPTGSLYLHCDPTAGHYLKVLLDAVFGSHNFFSEIVWKRYGAHGDAHRYGAVHDLILYYGKTKRAPFNKQFVPYTDEYAESRFRLMDENGRRYQEQNLSSPNPRPNLTYAYTASNGVTYYPHKNGWKCEIERMRELDRDGRLHFPKNPTGRLRLKMYLDESEGVPVQDLWTDITLPASSKERLGYPTQKPLALLERIISASSSPGDLVLDPFCGCGTTIEACERMGRRWIGIDIARKAVQITGERFEKLELAAPAVEWVPPDLEAAAALAAQSGNKFEEWARRKVRAVKRRKRDRGIDGEAFFRDTENRVTHVLVSVKSGKLNPAMVRELRGTIEREHAPIGVLVTMQEPSKEMRREATLAGFIAAPDGTQVPRLQILTMAQVFNGEGIRAHGVNITEMPQPAVPTGEPANQGQLSLRLDPAKPLAKTKAASAASNARKRRG